MSESIKVIEHACLTLQNTYDINERKEAELSLEKFRQSSSPYLLSFEILKVSNIDAAKYQALSAIKIALSKEWQNDNIDLNQILDHLIQYVLNNADNKVSSYVYNQVCHIITIIFKYKWILELNNSSSLTISDQILNLIQHYMNPTNFSLSIIKLMYNIIDEFAISSCSSLGLLWEQHIICHREFENKCLHSFAIIIFTKLKDFILQPQYIENNLSIILLLLKVIQVS